MAYLSATLLPPLRKRRDIVKLPSSFKTFATKRLASKIPTSKYVLHTLESQKFSICITSAYIFIAETINEPLVQLLKCHSDAKKYCEIVESMWKNGDDTVRNVLDVTILERLSDDKVIWQEFGKVISLDFKNYINNEVLVHNVMMSSIKRLP